MKWFAAACLLITSVAVAQVKLKGSASGLPDAQITYFHKLSAEGSKLVSLSTQFSGIDGKTLRVRTERSYAKDGSPIRIFQETVSKKPSFRNSVTVTFTTDGAHAVIDESGKRSVKDFPLASSAPRKCNSEFWFLRDMPKVGQTEKYYHFDPSKLEWKIVESTYIGPVNLKIGAANYPAHKIVSKEGESIVDEKGFPLKVSYPTVTMIRVP